MRASQFLFQDATGAAGAAAAADPPGFAELLAGGYVVRLGAGLLCGTPALQRVLARVEDELLPPLRALGAREVALPATDGQALVNFAARCGRLDGRPLLLLARGAGFREEAPESHGLFEAHLYRRLDLVQVGDETDAGLDTLRTVLGSSLRRFELSVVEEPGAPASVSLSADLGGGRRERLGELCRRALDPARAEPCVVLAHLDLFALLGALAAVHRDERGLRWPARLSPFVATVLPVGDAAAALRAEKLAVALEAAGHEILLDERTLAPAAKRRDAERLGLPARLLCGAEAESVVLESRAGEPPRRLPLAEVAGALAALLAPGAPGPAAFGPAAHRSPAHGPAARRAEARAALRRRATY